MLERFFHVFSMSFYAGWSRLVLGIPAIPIGPRSLNGFIRRYLRVPNSPPKNGCKICVLRISHIFWRQRHPIALHGFWQLRAPSSCAHQTLARFPIECSLKGSDSWSVANRPAGQGSPWWIPTISSEQFAEVFRAMHWKECVLRKCL